ncbi:glycosylase [Sulfitobacter sp. SK011]|uniref:glycosylase n=1 Tax=Sulfitobacter sp. SK011 TaxID=1389004 RepID=UPI000E0B7B3D|nr:glycosylase [Sulfitobacter sp. SK011]AXI40697.1 glycosylase [Sulfitobacter sp. SK011]
MFEWEKLGLVIDVESLKDRPEWFWEYAQAPNVIVHDDFVRVYFCCRPKPDAEGQFVSYGNYADLNRKDLFEIVELAEKPIMLLGDLGTFDEFGTYPISTIRDEDSTVYAYYGGWSRCESVPFNVSIGRSRSNDGGKTFEKEGKGPVLGHSLNDPFVVTSPKIRKYDNIWYLIYTAGVKWFISEDRPEIIYKLRLARSQDGLNWDRLDQNIIPDKLGEDEAQACGDVLLRNGVYHMFFCYREATDFRFAKDRTYRIGYARSEDMVHWERDDSKVGIDVSTTGWDADMVAYPTVFELDEQIYMLYLGNQVGRHGIGLARLKGDLT